MTVYNLGSINADVFYMLPHLVGPGETLAASSLYEGLGGKGANMSVAVARAGSVVHHIGAVGADGAWAIERLADYGVGTSFIQTVDEKTGHAIIMVDDNGENAIVIYSGANLRVSDANIAQALGQAKAGDFFITQNETNAQALAAKTAKDARLRVVYAAAPFDASAATAVLPYLDLLILNQIEAEQLQSATGMSAHELPIADVIVTLGSSGCFWHDNSAGTETKFAAQEVTPIDTTGAGDTFTGFVLAALDQGKSMAEAIDLGTKAAAIMVTRKGTADVIPTLAEVQNF
jgi:ribokinase